MRKAVSVVILLSFSAFGCDLCNFLHGINPFYTQSNSISLNMLWQRSTHSGSGHAGHGVSAETRKTLETGYRYHAGSNLLISAVLPVTAISGNEADAYWGPGDFFVAAHYIRSFALGSEAEANILAGGGMQLPTGKAGRRGNSGALLEPSAQAGAGTPAYIANLTTVFSLPWFDVGADLLYRFTQRNKFNSASGNAFTASATVSKELARHEPAMLAAGVVAGIRYEGKENDVLEGSIVTGSKTAAMFANGGIMISYYSLQLSINALIPVSQARGSSSYDEETRLLLGSRLSF